MALQGFEFRRAGRPAPAAQIKALSKQICVDWTTAVSAIGALDLARCLFSLFQRPAQMREWTSREKLAAATR
jgi:hypothetical protein